IPPSNNSSSYHGLRPAGRRRIDRHGPEIRPCDIILLDRQGSNKKARVLASSCRLKDGTWQSVLAVCAVPWRHSPMQRLLCGLVNLVLLVGVAGRAEAQC